MPNSNINMNIDVHLQNNIKETRTNVENGFNSFTQYRKVTNGKATNCSVTVFSKKAQLVLYPST